MAQRDARLKTVCRFVCHIQIEDARHAHLADEKAFAAFLAPLKRTRWFVYSKRPFAGPKAVLAYLARYTHRVAISNSRLIAADAESVTFKAKDYRVEGPRRYTTMTLASPTVTVRVPL